MNEEPVLPDQKPCPTGPKSIRFILPNAAGDAIGEDKEIDAESIGFAMPGGTASTCRYGVAYVPYGKGSNGKDSGRATAGAQGAAIVHRGGRAEAGDSGMAYAWTGNTFGGMWSTAFSQKGNARVSIQGVAVVQRAGSAAVGPGGVACGLNLQPKNPTGMETISNLGIVSGGVGSVVVAFGLDSKGRRVPVVGFIGEEPDWLEAAAGLVDQLADSGVQFGLKAGQFYRLEAKTNRFEEVAKPAGE